MRRLTFMVLALAGALLLLGAPVHAVIPGDGGASVDTGLYTHDACPASQYNQVDPINVVFWNWGTTDRAINNLGFHSGWTSGGGSTQYFTTSQGCYEMAAQRGSGGSTDTRFHIRLKQVPNYSYGYTTVGDAHHEDWVWYCNNYIGGHAVDSNGPDGSGFDQGRRQIRITMENGGHSWSTQWWGNTNNFHQCDGDHARSDGNTLFVNLHQGYH